MVFSVHIPQPFPTCRREMIPVPRDSRKAKYQIRCRLATMLLVSVAPSDPDKSWAFTPTNVVPPVLTVNNFITTWTPWLSKILYLLKSPLLQDLRVSLFPNPSWYPAIVLYHLGYVPCHGQFNGNALNIHLSLKQHAVAFGIKPEQKRKRRVVESFFFSSFFFFQ